MGSYRDAMIDMRTLMTSDPTNVGEMCAISLNGLNIGVTYHKWFTCKLHMTGTLVMGGNDGVAPL